MAIEVVNRQRLVPVDRRRVSYIAQATLAAVCDFARGSRTPHMPQNRLPEQVLLTVAFVRDAAIRKLNREYRGKDGPTDVLSFPDSPEQTYPQSARSETPRYLGDIVISTDTALKQAGAAGHSFEREVSELAIHGILHLCGYDHETDQGEMNRLELKLRRKLLENDD